jgi:hypothetical protein
MRWFAPGAGIGSLPGMIPARHASDDEMDAAT